MSNICSTQGFPHSVRRMLFSGKLAVLHNAAPDHTPKNDFTGKLARETMACPYSSTQGEKNGIS